MTRDEQLELAALVGLAWEKRGTPQMREAVDRIIDWHDRRQIRAYQRRLRAREAALQILRETRL